MKEKIRDNGEKIKQNKVLPYLVGNVVEVRICTTFTVSLLFIVSRFLMWTLRARKMAPTAIWIPCARANALSSRHQHDKLSSSP